MKRRSAKRLSLLALAFAVGGVAFLILQLFLVWQHFLVSERTPSTPHSLNTTGFLESSMSLRSPDFHGITNFSYVPKVSSRYAYSFIIGSIHETRLAYKGFLYNVLLSVEMLRNLGSQADFILYLQASPDANLIDIRSEDRRLLTVMNIRTIWLPKPAQESFSDLMFDKFRILQVTDYERIIYLDADVLPITNLDYVFKLSDPEEASLPTILRPYVMQASSAEPANGGLFMVHPNKSAWDQLQDVIAKQREDGKTLPYPNFHRGRGWGHKFRKKLKDSWHAASKNGTNWVFHGAHADQGLLYYFFRFVLQDASAIVGSRVENWVHGEDPDTPVIDSVSDRALLAFSETPLLVDPSCNLYQKTMKYTCYPPYRDFIHFTGHSKPWQNELKKDWLTSSKVTNIRDGARLWFLELQHLHNRIDLKMNLSDWNSVYLPQMEESPLGYHPLYTDNTNRIFDNHTSMK